MKPFMFAWKQTPTLRTPLYSVVFICMEQTLIYSCIVAMFLCFQFTIIVQLKEREREKFYSRFKKKRVMLTEKIITKITNII